MTQCERLFRKIQLIQIIKQYGIDVTLRLYQIIKMPTKNKMDWAKNGIQNIRTRLENLNNNYDYNQFRLYLRYLEYIRNLNIEHVTANSFYNSMFTNDEYEENYLQLNGAQNQDRIEEIKTKLFDYIDYHFQGQQEIKFDLKSYILRFAKCYSDMDEELIQLLFENYDEQNHEDIENLCRNFLN